MNILPTKCRTRFAAAMLAGVCSFATSAFAQQAPAPETKPETDTDAIVVTAQRRVENLQDVSAAATAISGDSLEDKGVVRLDGLQFVSPGLTITDAGLAQQVNIRGIGLATVNPAIANGVATYVDGVFQPPIVTSSSFYDIGSVEVFRGPQGTFVGSNSTGGAIFINSRNPNLSKVEGYAQAMAGNYSTVGLEGGVNVPLTSTLAVRVAGIYNKRDSFYRDIGPLNNTPGRLDEYAGRIGLLWKPSDSFQALMKTEWGVKDTGGYAVRPITGTAYSAYRSANIRTVDFDSPTRNDERSFQSTLELRYVFAGGITLRSLSGYQNKRLDNLYDGDATNKARYSAPDAPILTQQANNIYARERVYTEEINIISPDDGALKWIVGGYFQRNLINVPITLLSNEFPTNILTINKKTTLGIFGQATYALSPKLSVDAGLRYTSYDVSQTGFVAIGAGIPGFPSTGLVVADLSGAHKDSRVTGKLALNWQPNEDNLIYAFVARGYKPGGFASATAEFKPETVIDYEAGWKSTLLDGHLRTQLGAFFYDYKNFQFSTLDAATTQINPGNLTGAKIKGIEGQLQLRAGGFKLEGGFAYLDSKLGSATFVDYRAVGRAFPGAALAVQCPAGQPTTLPTCIDYAPFVRSTSGGTNLYSPRWTYNASISYELDLQSVVITPQLNYGYVGSQFTYIGYSPISDRLDSRGLLSAQLSLQAGDFTVEVFGTNLTDKDYVSGQDGNYEFYGAPRQYGVRLKTKF